MLTFQDYEKAEDKVGFIAGAITRYKSTDEYKTAIDADEYDAQRNIGITKAVRTIYSAAGIQKEDNIASSNKLASNFFNRLNTQRCMYSLGNGVSFVDPFEAAEGKKDETKERLGKHFDHVLREAGINALKHGRSYLFWDSERAYEFEATEIVPLEDENDGSLRACIRFWQIEQSKPLNVVLYEEDGYTKYRSGKDGRLEEVQPKRAYKVKYNYTDAGDMISVHEENYVRLPVVRMYGSRLKQSTLVGMRNTIDAYDLINSGLANDVIDCAEIYWIVENYGGMDQSDLAQFLDRLKLHHIANADTQSGGRVTPYTQEVPHQSRQAVLAGLRSELYEGFGALDVHVIAAGATNDHIDAAYQPLDENAADFEHWVSDAIVQLLELQGIDDVPLFKRNRISNHKEQVEMLVQEAAWLPAKMIIRKFPNLTPDEAVAAIEGKEQEDMERMSMMAQVQLQEEEESEGE